MHIRVKDTQTKYFLAVFAACLLSLAGTAYAQCVPGLPCVTPLTPNTPLIPYDPTDGPNEPGADNADKTMSASCDADFMNQIHSRAFLEAQREAIKLSTIIRKPDSVLELTCFDQVVAHVAHDWSDPAQVGSLVDPRAGLFTETRDWLDGSMNIRGRLNTPIPTPPWPLQFPPIQVDVYTSADHLDDAIEDLVHETLDNYIDGNFRVLAAWPGLPPAPTPAANISRWMLGGSLFAAGAPPASPWSGGVQYTMAPGLIDPTAPGNPPYYTQIHPDNILNCDYLNTVWFAAKCQDFVTDDQFLSLNSLSGLDPRLLPADCSPGQPPVNTGITTDLIDLANNATRTQAYFENALVGSISTDHASLRASTPCMPPIPTGVRITKYFRTISPAGNVEKDTAANPPIVYDEHVCPNPGCYYDPVLPATSGGTVGPGVCREAP